MPKPFMLGVEIEEVALGNVLRKLNGMPGVVNIHMDFKGVKPNGHAKTNGAGLHGTRRGRPPGTGRVFTTTGREDILEMLASAPGKQMELGAMKDRFAQKGRSPGSINSLMHVLQKDGMITRKGDGIWSLSKKGVDQAKRAKKKPPPAKSGDAPA